MKKYYEIYLKIKNEILTGVYTAGQKIPSKRVMADLTGCSEITVMTAYEMLESEGYIVAKERSGYFVMEIDGFLSSKPTKDISELEEPKKYDNEQFEYSLWLKTIRKVISEKDRELFIKAPTEGCAVLRNSISKYLLRYRGMVVSPKNIIIGSGSEQLYELAVKILGKDKVYGIENPCYEQIPKVYEQAGVNIVKLNISSDGIDSSFLNDSFDVLHVTPFNSYPTGVTASIKKRYEYLKWAKGDKYIIEDDFASEFFMRGNPTQTLYSLDDSGKVIYINTFSKSLSKSMRLGYMIIPNSLINIYNEKMQGFSCSVPVLDQYVLSEFINSGSFERHLNRIRRLKKQLLK